MSDDRYDAYLEALSMLGGGLQRAHDAAREDVRVRSKELPRPQRAAPTFSDRELSSATGDVERCRREVRRVEEALGAAGVSRKHMQASTVSRQLLPGAPLTRPEDFRAAVSSFYAAASAATQAARDLSARSNRLRVVE